MTLAPIIIFCYNRPLHTKNLLDSLVKNKESKNSVLYIFCDGQKETVNDEGLINIIKTREICNAENRFKEVVIKIQDKNKGLANSIIDGVTEVLNKHNKVIVLEDDLILSPFFLSYMNDSLDRYENDNNIGQIGACNFFACGKKFPEFFFTNIPDSLGWATWKNRWDLYNPNATELYNLLLKNESKKYIFNVFDSYNFMGMLDDQINNRVSSWAIRWQAVCVLNDWLTLYPNPSLTNHIESDNPTHAKINITPPLVNTSLIFKTQEKSIDKKVIKAMKLGFSGKGDYFGKSNVKNTKIYNSIKINIKKWLKILLKKIYNWQS